MPTTTWRLCPWGNVDNAYIAVEVDPSMIRGQRGVFGAALLIDVKFTPAPHIRPEIRFHAIEGWITWGAESEFLPGIRIPSQVIDLNTKYLQAPITDEQIEAIEERRNGDALLFKVTLRGMATIPNLRETIPRIVQQSGASPEVQSVPLSEVQAVWEVSNTGQPVRIEREQWLKILEGLGKGKRRLIELPQPHLPTENEQAWTEYLRLLTEATVSYRTGQFEQVLNNCRKVVEGVTEVLCNHWGIKRDPKKPITKWAREVLTHLSTVWTNDPEDAKLFYALLPAAFSWTSGTHHYGSGIPLRDEVSFALSLTTDLLAFGAQILTAVS